MIVFSQMGLKSEQVINIQFLIKERKLIEAGIIGKHVWLGASSVIMKGVNIGNGSIVGMCSLVTKNIPSNCVVAGIPSQIVKEDIYWEK